MSDRGAASIVAAVMLAVLVLLTGAGALVGSAVVARHRAQTAADLAALAAAGRLASGKGEACETAAMVGTRMGGRVSACDVAELDVVVVVEIPVRLGRWGAGLAVARARAGPAEG